MRADRHSSVPNPGPGTSSLPPGFTDEVMRAIGRAPRPSPARSFQSALRARSATEALGALSVALRIIRRSTSMPMMVRAQALALVLFIAGSMLGGGALAAVVAYQAVGPIVHAISEPAGDRDRSANDAVQSTPSPAAVEMPHQTLITAEPAAPRVEGPDRPATRSAPNTGSMGPGDRDDADSDEADEPDGDEDKDIDDEADPDEADGEADGPDADDLDDADEPDGDTDAGESDEADEPSDEAESSGSEDSSDGGEPDGAETVDGSGGG